MSKDPGWWTDWLIPLLIVSVVCLIFNGGLALSAVLWVLYLSEGRKVVERNPSEENQAEFAKNLVLGIIVFVVSVIIVVVAKLKY